MDRWPDKDPNAILDYELDWSAWLIAANSDTIATSTWIVPDGLTRALAGDSHNDTSAVIWLSGGTAGQLYTLTNRITTTGGRTEDRTRALYVKEQ